MCVHVSRAVTPSDSSMLRESMRPTATERRRYNLKPFDEMPSSV